ncbi:2-keto-4-pentenoate hydratase/2-oxohepta-3-ene-1,7-dioic acid hydratase (catechol pathway) [Thalassovita litoralis]|jgi:2-keto-4-pentenoate hydratase/2-oxohepta-3-ene-1,7-dioic acid hydratase in catechol pathway|uniref:2-keto-4-pentenoate hydratase/2-oxohepta-3-ene-1,7-dioic acid hydratase (Catechol pathway) n=1 Tax=Thalassovita litoralis TaxID=1010611 RepID=A0A521B379_9RHOB|nr:fumarylacetoacetate hydrolase family protein [Thalassovita litoralis]SMO41496.1 2-keto-4-pentenoate hydratase/2-oxohepta-3-ene-1,7-dioic acid hydratase (catechol pathway) [Thalassovita litoralis]
MRLVSFQLNDGTQSYGVIEGDAIRAADTALTSKYADLRAVLTAGATAELAGSTGPVLALADVTLLSPLPNPDKIICIGLNYMSHIKETGRDKPKHPSIFTRYPSSVIGHDVPLVRPKASQDFDYEGELAVIIGKEGRHIAQADAWDHIAGYSCFNDGSIRDYQIHTSQFWPGKSFDDSGSMGPWIVTADDLPDVTEQTLTTRINGNVEQQSKLDDLAISIPEIIAYVSTVTKLLPGDVIATGTPGGVGKFRKPQLYMKPGDVAEVEITGIGILRNGVVDEA